MKKILIFLSFFLFTLISCKDNDCEIINPICSETIPTNEACYGLWKRWFYNSSSSTCEKIEYGGCEAYGFLTKEECEACKCND